MDGSTFKDCFSFDIDARNVTRHSNIKALAFGRAVTVGEELYFGLKPAGRLGKYSTIYSPASGVKNDADGTAVTPILETVLFRDRPGKKTWRSLYVTYDMRDAASDNPILTVSYIKNPEDAYTALSTTLAESAELHASTTRAPLPGRRARDQDRADERLFRHADLRPRGRRAWPRALEAELMSEFKPEGYLGANPLKELSDTKPLEDADVALIARVFQDPRRIPAVFWSYLQSWLEANPPLLPISQIVGFSQFTTVVANARRLAETTTSQRLTNLATVGPQLTGLSDGIYDVIVGLSAAVRRCRT